MNRLAGCSVRHLIYRLDFQINMAGYVCPDGVSFTTCRRPCLLPSSADVVGCKSKRLVSIHKPRVTSSVPTTVICFLRKITCHLKRKMSKGTNRRNEPSPCSVDGQSPTEDHRRQYSYLPAASGSEGPVSLTLQMGWVPGGLFSFVRRLHSSHRVNHQIPSLNLE